MDKATHTERTPLSSDTRRNWLKKTGAILGASICSTRATAEVTTPALVKSSSQQPVRMMYNENPLPASPKVKAAMTAALEEANTYSYFELLADFKKVLAEKEGVSPEEIVVGAGSTEILRVTALQLIRNSSSGPGRVIANSPGYESMNTYAENLGAEIVRVPVLDDLSPDLAGLAKEVKKGATFLNLCNPNNPTAVIVPEKTLTPFCQEMAQETFVFVDEAYHEFVTDPNYRTMLPLVKEGQQVMVTRTFSKLFALAGLRIGYGIANPKLVAQLEASLTGTVNIVALRAAMAGLADQEFQATSLKNNVQAKEIFLRKLADLGLKAAPSEGNFVFFHTGMPIQEFQQKMLQKGFRVGRPFPPYLDWCRLSMTTPDQMELFCSALEEVVS
ncbi:histidinol-phosphate transaminase [Roseibacillus persicicus]|uniref:pyridoxal phosphate-dependent aminotransferase n=1 Tax=Roseibacillus persicicus TaxID=454148 RepID=UPI00398AC6C5